MANWKNGILQSVWPIGKDGIYQMCGQWEDDINKLFDKWDNYLTECVMCIANGMLR